MANKTLFENTSTSTSKFKNDGGVLLTKSLFLETSANRDRVLYTLRDDETRGYPSLRRLYLETADVTEYTFANQYFENWDHWKSITEATWFKSYISSFRSELEIKLKSEELARIREVAESGGKDSLQASRYLLDKGYGDTPLVKRGRPTKDQVDTAARKMAEDRQRIEDDFERIVGHG